MASLALKRIASDMKVYMKSDLQNCGIYCHFCEENMYNVKVLIIGPKDTPYENGFHLFDVNYPKDYPINPPHVKFMSTDTRVRAHPNLYINGKVCLSFLGTWSGPSWTPALTLNTILLSIQSLLNDNPIQCEPGYETEKGTRANTYKNVVNYYNILVSTLKVMTKLTFGFENFEEVIHRHFIKNYDSYLKQLDRHKNSKEYASCIYGRGAIVKYKEVLTGLKEQFEVSINYIKDIDSKISDKHIIDISEPNLNIIENETHENKELESKNTDSNIKEKVKGSRKAPNIKAKDHDIGYEYISENDEKLYVVIETKSGYKRWVRKI